MNIALIGHGRMGKEVETVARDRGHTIVSVFSSLNNLSGAGIDTDGLKGVDVCIDFSTPAAVIDNIEAVTDCGKNMVVGTTGWYDQLAVVRTLVKERKTGFLYAPNFSLGVNIFMQIVMDAAHLFEPYTEYDAAVHEIHHRGKADSPSGTALSLASTILQEIKRKAEVQHETVHGTIKPEHLHVTSTRVGHYTGKHTVVFDSEADTIELVHTSKNRRGFALGALVAAEWLKGKKGFYTMRDVILPE